MRNALIALLVTFAGYASAWTFPEHPKMAQGTFCIGLEEFTQHLANPNKPVPGCDVNQINYFVDEVVGYGTTPNGQTMELVRILVLDENLSVRFTGFVVPGFRV